MSNQYFKRIRTIVTFFLVTISLASCVHVHHPGPRRTVVVKEKRIPPGHAKKMHGDKSARNHAPGHNR